MAQKPTASIVTAVQVHMVDHSPVTVWEMPVRTEQRDDLTALVFHTASELTTVTVLLSEGDRKDLIKMLGGRTR